MRNIQNLILDNYDLSDYKIERVLSTACAKNIDFADIYFQYKSAESWTLEDGIVKNGSSIIDSGVGIRSVCDDKSGFAYSNDFNYKNLVSAANMSKCIVKHGDEKKIKIGEPQKIQRLYDSISPLELEKDDVKVKFLKDIESYIRNKDSRVDQVIINISASYDSILVINTDGIKEFDERPLVRFNVSVILEKNGKKETGVYGIGGRQSYDEYLKNDNWKNVCKEALRIASVNLESKPAPAGEMKVVLGSGWPAILIHEAIGHGLEGDFNRKKKSEFHDLMGQKIASEGVTIVDDGTIDKRRGSLTIDDEGTPTERTVLIENGILKKFMQDRLNARLMNTRSTGSGRRENYKHIVLPRMRNTMMLSGKQTREEMIKSVDKGIFAVSFGGGQVDITSGKFVFNCTEAYEINNGKIGSPIKGATLIGDGPSILKEVSMVGNDMMMDPGIGTCGKAGQGVPVGVAQPSILINKMTVGGTKL